MTNTVNFKEIAKSKDPKQIAVKVSKSRKKSGRAFYYVNYRSVLTVGSKDNGQRFFQTRDAAEQLCTRINEAQKHGGFISETAAGTFDEIAKIFIAHTEARADRKVISVDHKDHVVANAKQWCELEFNGQRLGDVKVTEIKHFENETYLLPQFDVGEKTLNEKLMVLKSMYAKAQDMELCGHVNPAKNVKIEAVKYDNEEDVEGAVLDRKDFSGEVLESIFDAIEDDRKRLIVEFAALTGLRFGEQAALKWKYIDFEEGMVHVVLAQRKGEGGTYGRSIPKTTGKGKKQNRSRRSVPIGAELIKDLKAHKLASPYSGDDDLVFPIAAGLNVDPAMVGDSYKKADPWRDKILLRATEKLGLPNYRWHDLRHFYASTELHIHAFKDMGDIVRISARLGHHSIDFTYQQYSHWVEDKEQNKSDAAEHEKMVFKKRLGEG